MSIAGNVIQILAGLPEFLRKPMMRNRISDFFALPDEDKIEMIKGVIDALPTVDVNITARLFRTWIEVLYELGNEKSTSMFSMYASILTENPSILASIDLRPIVKEFNSLNKEIRDSIASSIRDVLNRLEDEKRDALIKYIPVYALDVIGYNS